MGDLFMSLILPASGSCPRVLGLALQACIRSNLCTWVNAARTKTGFRAVDAEKTIDESFS
jgi:hypothetical protein